MSTKRQWDESRSPQWKYLLQKESRKKRKDRQTKENRNENRSSTPEDEQLVYPLYRQRALTKAERRERRVQQLKKEYENSK